jgi:tetratricopeptide (TPR) repeat protein
VADAFKEFSEGKIVPDGADPRKTLVEGAKIARQKAESPLSIPLAQLGMSLGGIGTGTSKAVEQTFDLSKVFSELGFFRTREPFVQTPEEKLDTHMALLADRKRNDAKELGAITREADWVLSKESKADDEARSKARFVQGLALRNLEKFGDARTAFAETLKTVQALPKTGTWTKAVAQAQREITDPTAYYIPRMDGFRTERDYKSAFDEANTALKAMPEDARLYALRGLIRYESVRGQGAKIPADAQKEIRADTDMAAMDEKVAAESAYIVGLLEEDLGNWPEAEKNFRQALKLHQGAPEDAGKYRVSLARLLLRDRNEVLAPQPE